MSTIADWSYGLVSTSCSVRVLGREALGEVPLRRRLGRARGDGRAGGLRRPLLDEPAAAVDLDHRPDERGGDRGRRIDGRTRVRLDGHRQLDRLAGSGEQRHPRLHRRRPGVGEDERPAAALGAVGGHAGAEPRAGQGRSPTAPTASTAQGSWRTPRGSGAGVSRATARRRRPSRRPRRRASGAGAGSSWLTLVRRRFLRGEQLVDPASTPSRVAASGRSSGRPAPGSASRSISVSSPAIGARKRAGTVARLAASSTSRPQRGLQRSARASARAAGRSAATPTRRSPTS